MFIFARCLRSSAAVTPAKYELDVIQVTTVLIIRKKWENNGTENIGLVTPTPLLGLLSSCPIFDFSYCHRETALLWRHNGRGIVSNHQPHDCLLNRLFRRRSKKTSKLRVTGLYAGNSPGTGEFPAQMARNAENCSIWWRHHGTSVNVIFWCLIFNSKVVETWWYNRVPA